MRLVRGVAWREGMGWEDGFVIEGLSRRSGYDVRVDLDVVADWGERGVSE